MRTICSLEVTLSRFRAYYRARLSKNGYEVLKGNRLKLFKEVIQGLDVHETNFGNIENSLTQQLGPFALRYQIIEPDFPRVYGAFILVGHPQ